MAARYYTGKEIPGDGYALPNVQATGAVYSA